MRPRVPALALLLSLSVVGCDDTSTDLGADRYGPWKPTPPAAEHQAAAAAFEAAVAPAYGIQPQADCTTAKKGGYGTFLLQYLEAASEGDEDGVSNMLTSLHEHLQCASAREFTMVADALHGAVLSNAFFKGKPVVRDIDAALLPLTVLLHDMGAKTTAPRLGLWMGLRRHQLASLAKGSSVVKDNGLYVSHGDNLRRVNGVEYDRVFDALLVGSHMSTCGLAELVSIGGSAVCPSDCTSLQATPITDPVLADAVETMCDAAQSITVDLEGKTTHAKMTKCINTFKAQTGNDHAVVCLRERFEQSGLDDLTLDGETEVRIDEQCQVSQDSTPLPQDLQEALIEEKEELLADLLQGIAAYGDDLAEADNETDEVKLRFIQIYIDAYSKKIGEVTKDIESLQSGGSQQRCTDDAQFCSDTCGIKSQVQQITEECLGYKNPEQLPDAPDPIDPPEPTDDPDSPIAQLTECLSKAMGDEDAMTQDDCVAVLECPAGTDPSAEDGNCTCTGAQVAIPLGQQCDWLIDCSEDGPCSCDGAPMDGNPIPMPSDDYRIMTMRD